MNANTTIDIHASLDEFIKQKIQFHKQEISVLEKQLSLLTGSYLSSGSFAMETTIEPSKVIDLDYEGSLISQRTVKPILWDIFKESPEREFTTSELFDLLVQKKVSKPNDRAEWVTVISTALRNLKKNNRVKSENGISKGYVYSLNKENTSPVFDDVEDS